jgi:hypothetical protein
MVPCRCSKGILTAGRWRLALKELDKRNSPALLGAPRPQDGTVFLTNHESLGTARVDPLPKT